MSRKPLTIWFDQNGNMLTQAGKWNTTSAYIQNSGYKSEMAQDFSDKMEFVNLREYYRKNTRVFLKSTTSGREYSMFIDDFNKVLKNKLMVDLFITGTWRFIKRGEGQAIQLVIDENTP